MTNHIKKPNIKSVSIMVDANRFDRDSGNVAMLFDERNQCFYTVSLSAIIAKVKASMAEYRDSVMKELASKEAELDAKISSLEERQNKFIADAVATNDALIALVEKGE